MTTSLESCAKVSSFVTSDRLLLYGPRIRAPPRFRRSVSLCRYRVVLEMRLKFNFAKVAASNSLIGLWGIFGMSASICEISLVRVELKRARCCVYNVQCTLLLVTTEFIAKLISVGKSLPRNTLLLLGT